MRILITGFLMIVATGLAFSQSPYFLSDSEIKIDGTSTIHDWTSDVTKASVQGKFTIENNQLTALNEVLVSINVKDIKSTKGSIMDGKTWDALKAEKHPKISFKSTGIASLNAEGRQTKIRLKGLLTIAGVSKNTELDVLAESLGDGKIRFEGSKAIDMTAFGMEAPTALMGTIKTGKDVTIRFNVTMSGKTELSSPGK